MLGFETVFEKQIQQEKWTKKLMPYTELLGNVTWEPSEWLGIFQFTCGVQVALMCTGGNLANITHVGREAKNQLKIREHICHFPLK